MPYLSLKNRLIRAELRIEQLEEENTSLRAENAELRLGQFLDELDNQLGPVDPALVEQFENIFMRSTLAEKRAVGRMGLSGNVRVYKEETK